MNKRDHIEKELKELDSALAGMSRSMPYKVPQGYFKDVDSRVMARVAAQQNKAYSVPDGYFDKLPDAIIKKVKQPQEIEPKTKRVNISLKNFRLAAAAVILFFFSLGAYQIFTHTAPTTLATAEKLEQLPDEMILAYVEDHIDEFDIAMLEESAKTTNNNNHQYIDHIEDNTINDYLNNTGW